jgi:GNAT superfamily N-acetyltransferase
VRTIQPGPAARPFEARFPLDLPTRPRLLGVIDGTLAGDIRADDTTDPRWITVTERSDGTTYVAGTIEPDVLAEVFASVSPKSNEIVIGFAGGDDPVRAMAPAAGAQWSRAIDFTDRDTGSDATAGPVPAGLRLVEMDPAIFARTAWYEDTLVAFGSIAQWLVLGIGRALLDGDELVCEAMAGPAIRGSMEMGVRTAPAHRGRGYATITCRALAQAIEARGLVPWWNTNIDNAPSIAVARKIGFRHERPYDLVWYKVAEATERG